MSGQLPRRVGERKSRARAAQIRQPIQADLGSPVPNRKIFYLAKPQISPFYRAVPPMRRDCLVDTADLGRCAKQFAGAKNPFCRKRAKLPSGDRTKRLHFMVTREV